MDHAPFPTARQSANASRKGISRAFYYLPNWVICSNPVERPDLGLPTIFQKSANARQRMQSIIGNLSRRGHTINRCKTTYRLYVIELRPDTRRDGEAKAVYVGETASTREARFKQHMAGGKLASRYVASRGIKICPDLTPVQEYYTRAESKAAEERLANRLRARVRCLWRSLGHIQ
jgi:hypothetical protein